MSARDMRPPSAPGSAPSGRRSISPRDRDRELGYEKEPTSDRRRDEEDATRTSPFFTGFHSLFIDFLFHFCQLQ